MEATLTYSLGMGLVRPKAGLILPWLHRAVDKIFEFAVFCAKIRCTPLYTFLVPFLRLTVFMPQRKRLICLLLNIANDNKNLKTIF